VDLRDLLAASDSTWRGRAACRDERDASLFLSDMQLPRHGPGSPSIALALAVCAGCDVRRDCLREGVTLLAFPLPRWDSSQGRLKLSATTTIRLRGVWGGTHDLDRMAVAGLPVEQAVERLERTFPARLARELRAFRARHPSTRRDGHPAAGRVGRLHRLLANGQGMRLLAVTRRRCESCDGRLPALARSDARFCSLRCRVSAHRARAA